MAVKGDPDTEGEGHNPSPAEWVVAEAQLIAELDAEAERDRFWDAYSSAWGKVARLAGALLARSGRAWERAEDCDPNDRFDRCEFLAEGDALRSAARDVEDLARELRAAVVGGVS